MREVNNTQNPDLISSASALRRARVPALRLQTYVLCKEHGTWPPSASSSAWTYLRSGESQETVWLKLRDSRFHEQPASQSVGCLMALAGHTPAECQGDDRGKLQPDPARRCPSSLAARSHSHANHRLITGQGANELGKKTSRKCFSRCLCRKKKRVRYRSRGKHEETTEDSTTVMAFFSCSLGAGGPDSMRRPSSITTASSPSSPGGSDFSAKDSNSTG